MPSRHANRPAGFPVRIRAAGGCARVLIGTLAILVLGFSTGCRGVGFSAAVGSDPAGTGSDFASAAPARTSRTGQAYGRSGRARLKPQDSDSSPTASLGDETGSAPRTASAQSPGKKYVRLVTHDDDNASPLPDPDSEASSLGDSFDDEAPRSIPVTSDEPADREPTRRIPD